MVHTTHIRKFTFTASLLPHHRTDDLSLCVLWAENRRSAKSFKHAVNIKYLKASLLFTLRLLYIKEAFIILHFRKPLQKFETHKRIRLSSTSVYASIVMYVSVLLSNCDEKLFPI